MSATHATPPVSDGDQFHRAALESVGGCEPALAALLRCTSEGISLRDPLGRIVLANTQLEGISGLTRAELLGMSSFDALHYALRPDMTAMPDDEHPPMAAMRDARPIRDALMGYYPPSRELRWLMVNCVPIMDEGISVPIGMVTTVADVTDLHRPPAPPPAVTKASSGQRGGARLAVHGRPAVRTAAEAVESLGGCDKSLAALLECSGEGVWFEDAEGRVLVVNNTLRELLGAGAKRSAARLSAEIATQAPDASAAVRELTIDCRRSGGPARPLLANREPIRDDAGGIPVGLVTTVSELPGRVAKAVEHQAKVQDRDRRTGNE